MNRTIAVYTIMSLLGVGILGFVGVEFMNSHHASCIVSTSRGAFCPEIFNAVEFINFHFNTLKSFSTAVFGAGLQVALLLILFISALAAVLRSVSARPGTVVAVPAFSPTAVSPGGFISPSERRFMRWISLFENSPAAFLANG